MNYCIREVINLSLHFLKYVQPTEQLARSNSTSQLNKVLSQCKYVPFCCKEDGMVISLVCLGKRVYVCTFLSGRSSSIHLGLFMCRHPVCLRQNMLCCVQTSCDVMHLTHCKKIPSCTCILCYLSCMLLFSSMPDMH